MHLVYLYSIVWFLLTGLAANVGKKKGYTGWPGFALCVLGTVGVLMISLRAHNIETVAPFIWLFPLLVAGVSAVLPARG